MLILEGKVPGKREKGRTLRRWTQDTTESRIVSLQEGGRLGQDPCFIQGGSERGNVMERRHHMEGKKKTEEEEYLDAQTCLTFCPSSLNIHL